MHGRLEGGKKRSHEQADLSPDAPDAPNAGREANVLQQLAGSHKRHRGPSQTEQGQTSGLLPIASLLNSPEASSDSEQERSDLPPSYAELFPDHDARGPSGQLR